jgi:hypothetical protein
MPSLRPRPAAPYARGDSPRETATSPPDPRRECKAETAAREPGALSTSDALALVLLYQRSGDEKFERAARRWMRRVQVDRSLRRQEVELLRGAFVALGTRFDSVTLDALLETCRELRLPLPTVPTIASRPLTRMSGQGAHSSIDLFGGRRHGKQPGRSSSRTTSRESGLTNWKTTRHCIPAVHRLRSSRYALPRKRAGSHLQGGR